LLLEGGHQVTLHARNAARAEDARRALPGAEATLTGDLSSIAETRALAGRVNERGAYDAVIHNAGVGYRGGRVETVDGLSQLFAVNVLAPYILTALIARPKRLIYVSSGMHRGGSPNLDDAQWTKRRWNGSQAYSDSKLFDVVLAFGIARRRPAVRSNALHPGWVATKMGGRGAPDDPILGGKTQAWLATSDEPAALVTGEYFFHQQVRDVHPAARSVDVQDALLAYCEKLTGISVPA
jgi:NAD(P)-dependent dehydrogenase (short-subunit alcohol dehydrogenase family)